jgi:hypothetical protein
MLIYLMELNDDVKAIVDKHHLKVGKFKGKRVAVEVHGEELEDKVKDVAGSDVFGFEFGGINEQK